MKPHHAKGLCLTGLAILGVVQVSCSRGEEGAEAVKRFLASPHRVVTISYAGGTSGPCEVDYPVAFLRVSKHHTIAWYAVGHDFWVYFNNGSPISGANPLYVQQDTPVDYNVTLPQGVNERYYTYSIYDVQPPPNPSPTAACKTYADDHDTGLNVKP